MLLLESTANSETTGTLRRVASIILLEIMLERTFTALTMAISVAMMSQWRKLNQLYHKAE